MSLTSIDIREVTSDALAQASLRSDKTELELLRLVQNCNQHGLAVSVDRDNAIVQVLDRRSGDTIQLHYLLPALESINETMQLFSRIQRRQEKAEQAKLTVIEEHKIGRAHV